MKLLAAILFLFSVPAFADNMYCDALTAIDENRPATLRVQCKDYLSPGYIANDQKIASITLQSYKGAQNKTVIIKSPAEGIRAYARPMSNEGVRKELANEGINWVDAEGLRLVGFTVDPAVKVYKNSGPTAGTLENTPVLAKDEKPGSSAIGICQWETTPQIIKTPSCGPNNLCYGRVTCGSLDGTAICQAIGTQKTECPTADVCSKDKTIELSDPAKPGLKGWKTNGKDGFHLDEAGDEPTPSTNAN